MKTREQKKKMAVSIILVFLITILVWWKEQRESVLTGEGQLLRQENGQGEYDAELILEIDGSEETEMIVTVPEKTLTAKEEELLLYSAIREIEEEFVGANTSLEEVRNAVQIRERYQADKVQAEWEFSNHRLFAADGQIIENVMKEKKETVEAKVHLTCEDSSLIYEFAFIVYKQEKSEEEKFYEKLNQLISENSKAEGTEILWLPESLEGHTLDWTEQKSKLPAQVFFIGIIITMLLPALEKERGKEIQKKREEQLEREYPELVNKLTLLLGAGMTLLGAWKLITAKYVEERANMRCGTNVLYEEMLVTQREIESGKGEMKAYEAFGERCKLQKYRKLSNYLVQNMKKGNRGLCELLEREAEEAFIERKNIAQRYGEEVGTKLLLPMLLMLGIVILVIMIPAVISFQSGIR